uniref:Ubiquitin-like domain-containing protein n=1 Tax=Syphacia muris TaxID=451379 RepID=A0A0N5B123_9BILA
MATEVSISECQWAQSVSSSESVNLRLILVSGKTKDFVFSLNSSVEEIIQYVFEHWPSEWEEKVKSASLLKLIYHGRFLHGSLPLKTLDLPPGKTTVLHLVTRENIATSTSSGNAYYLFSSKLFKD